LRRELHIIILFAIFATLFSVSSVQTNAQSPPDVCCCLGLGQPSYQMLPESVCTSSSGTPYASITTDDQNYDDLCAEACDNSCSNENNGLTYGELQSDCSCGGTPIPAGQQMYCCADSSTTYASSDFDTCDLDCNSGTPPEWSVSGYVKDNVGNLIQDASVTLGADQTYSDNTNVDGEFLFTNVKQGQVALSASYSDGENVCYSTTNTFNLIKMRLAWLSLFLVIILKLLVTLVRMKFVVDQIK